MKRSLAETHATAFSDFVEEVPIDVFSEIMHDFLLSVEGDIMDLAAESPEREITILSDPSYAKKFVERWGAQHGDALSDDELQKLAQDFSDLVSDFRNRWSTLKAYQRATSNSDSEGEDNSSDDDGSMRRICMRFVEFISSARDDSPPTFSISELISFLVTGKYIRETFDAIREKNGARLLQLVLQDIPRDQEKRFPRSAALAEDSVKELIEDFHNELGVSDDIEYASRGNVRNDDEPDEETDEAYTETCKYFESCLAFAPQPRFVRKADFQNFLYDGCYYLAEKAHAIRNNDAAEFARVMSSWMQEQDDALERLVLLKDLEKDCAVILDEFTKFTNDTDDTYTLPGLFFNEPTLKGSTGNSYYGSYHLQDLEKYRNNHPELQDSVPRVSQNVDFYRGACEHPSYRCFIDDFHDVETYSDIAAAATTKRSTWFGNYGRLEAEHSFIQHLFPIQEGQGLSSHSQRLQKHEIETMRADLAIQERLLRSTETMLDFYGIYCERSSNGVFTLQRNMENCEKQFGNLNMFSHNYLRITRICKCLGDLGLENLQCNIVDFFIRECFEFEDLISLDDDSRPCYLPNLRSSLERYWVGTIRDAGTREAFEERIRQGKERLNPEASEPKQ